MLGYSLKFLFPPLNTTVERIMANQNQTSVSSAQFTELSADNAVYLESLYEQYLQDPQSVDEKYIPYFAQFAKDDDKNSSGDDMSKEISSMMNDWLGSNPSDDMQCLLDNPDDKTKTVKVNNVDIYTETGKIFTGREPEMSKNPVEKSVIDMVLSNEEKGASAFFKSDTYDPTEEFNTVNDVLDGLDDFY